MQSKQVCEPVTADNITDFKAIPTDSVKSFFKMLYTENLSTTEELSSKKSRLIDFCATYALFCCSAGKLSQGSSCL